MKGVTRGLYSAPLEYSSPASYMHIHECHSICTCIMTRRAENIMVPHCLSNRKSAILIQNSHFTPILIHFHVFYFFFLLLIQSVWSSDLEDEKLSKVSTYFKHGGCHCPIHFHVSSIKHEVLIASTYNFPWTTNSSHMYMMLPWIPPCINTVSYW